MIFVTEADIHDEVLRVDDNDIDAANNYVAQIAFSLNIDLSQIPNPPSFIIKRLGVCYACYNRALMEVGRDPVTNLDGSTTDINAQKRKLYMEELTSIKSSLTAEDFLGEPGGGARVVKLNRA